MANGVRTTDLNNSVAFADQLIVNREGSTGLQDVSDLAAQLSATGSIAEELAAVSLRTQNAETAIAQAQSDLQAVSDASAATSNLFVTPEAFGAEADLNWRMLNAGDLTGENASVKGPQFLGGTNDFNAFRLADRHARDNGKEIRASSAGYYIKSFERNVVNGLVYTFDLVVDDVSEVIVGLYEADLPVDVTDNSEKAELNHELLRQDIDYTVALNENGMGGTITIANASVISGYEELEVRVQFAPKVSLRSENDFNTVLWLHYGLNQQGIAKRYNDVQVTGFKIIGQHSRNGYKPAVGNWGMIAVHGWAYYAPDEMPNVERSGLRALLCRAPRIVTDSANGVAFQDSDGAIMSGVIGRAEKFFHHVGTFGHTTAASNHLVLLHWGCQYDAASIDPSSLDKSSADIIESYHCRDFDIRFLTAVDGDKHPITSRVWELAATGPGKVGPLFCQNVPGVYWIGGGDVGAAFAIDEQKADLCKGIKIGFQTGRNISPVQYGIQYKHTGTSKIASEYDPVSEIKQRQVGFGVVCEGHDLEFADGTLEGIRAREVLGSVDLGRCRIRNTWKPIYHTHGTGKLTYDLFSSDGTVHHQGAKGINITKLATNKGNNLNSDKTDPYPRDTNIESDYFFCSGYGADNAVAFFEGQVFTTTVAAVGSVGDDLLTINPFTENYTKVLIGDTIRINDVTHIATDITQTGEAVIKLSGGLKVAVAVGDVITLDKRCMVDAFNGAYSSSEYGIVATRTTFKNCDLSDVKWTGRHMVRLLGQSYMNLEGVLPATNGRLPSSTCRSVYCDYSSRVFGHGLVVENNVRDQYTFFLQTSASEAPYKAILSLNGGLVEQPSNLFNASAVTDRVFLNGVLDGAGNVLPSA